MTEDCPVYTSKGEFKKEGEMTSEMEVGDYVACEIVQPGTGTHIVKPLYKTTLAEFYSKI